MIVDPRQLQKVSDDIFDGSHTTDVGMYKKTIASITKARVLQAAVESNKMLMLPTISHRSAGFQWHTHIDCGSTLGMRNLTSVRKGAGD